MEQGNTMGPSNEGYGVQDSILKSDGSGGEFLHLKAGGCKTSSYQTIDNREHFVFQDGSSIQSIEEISRCFRRNYEKKQIGFR